MASRIKGLTVEINGDVTKLDKALSSADKQLKDLDRSLKDVDRLLKLDPTNTELLAQKQQLLQKSVDTTKERLETLRSAAENVTPDDIGQDKYDALQREIIETEQKLQSLTDKSFELSQNMQKNADISKNAIENLGDAMSKTGEKLQGVGDKLKGAGDKVTGVAKGMAPVSAAAAGVAAGAVAAAKELDAGYDTIITKTGATGEAAEALKDQMDRVFGSIPTDAEKAGIAVGEVNTRFGLTGDALGDLSQQFIEFSEINGTDLNNSIDQVDAIMTKFGLDVEDTQSVLGLMTKAGQDTGISMDTLYAALDKNGAIFKEMGLSLPESINLLAQFEANGVDTSTAMAALKKAQKEAASEGKSLDDVLGEQIESIKNATTETEAMQIATELFGAKGAPEMAQAIREGRINIDDLSASLDSYKTTVQDTYESTLDPWDQLTTTTNNLKVAGADLAGEMLTNLQPTFDAITEKVTALTTWYAGLDEGTKQNIATILLLVAAIAPVLGILGGLIGTIGTIVGAIGTVITVVGGAISTIGAIMGSIQSVSGLITVLGAVLTGPVGIVVAIAAVIAAGVALWKNWDTVKEKAGELKENVAQKWEDLKTAAQQKFDGIKNAISEKWDGIKQAASDKWSQITDAVSNKAQEIHNKVSEKFDNVKNTVSDVVDHIKGLFNFDWSLPDLKLPHIVVGDYIDVPVLGTIPDPRTLSVEWYDKAMDRARVLNSPTVFGAAGGRLLAGGESGNEVVSGEKHLIDLIDSVVRSRTDGMTAVMADVVGILDRYMPQVVTKMDRPVVLDTGATVGGLGDDINSFLGRETERDKYQ